MQAENSFFINGSMGRLNALLDLPELTKGGQCPLVICLHGFGGDLDFHLWPLLAARLNEHGIGVLRFDFNGCGGSDGEFQDMTVGNEIDDALDVIAYARDLGRFSSISLVGHSQGGVVAGMAAGRCGSRQIAALVLLSAAAVLRDDALRGSSQGAVYDPWHLDKPFYEVPGRGLRLGRAYIQNAMDLPIYETTAAYAGPALILNGMADRVVPCTYAQRYHQALAASELVLVPGEDHAWSHDPDYAAGMVAGWLEKQLKR